MKFIINFSVVISIFFGIEVKSQTYFELYNALHFKNSLATDSLFETYEEPQIADSLWHQEWLELFVLVYFDVGYEGEVTEIKILPLKEISDQEYANNELLWDNIKQEILEKSKKWKLKELYWKYEGDNPKIHRTVEQLNSDPSLHPFCGRAKHILIFHFQNIVSVGDIPFLYFLNVK